MLGKTRSDLHSSHQLGQGHVKRQGEDLKRAQAGFFLAAFNIGDERAAQAAMYGKVCLRPPALLSQLPNAESQSLAHVTLVTWHSSNIAVCFRIHFAYRIQGESI